jgi:hypothetical protein
MLALHIFAITTTGDDNKGLNRFHPAFHGKHALESVPGSLAPPEPGIEVYLSRLGKSIS